MRLVKGLLDRCFEVIELLAHETQWQRLSDIASRLDLQKGPAHRLLAQMSELGWVEQDEATERYRLTLKLALLGQQYLHGTGLPGLVKPILDEVAGKCRELVRMTVIQGDGLHWFASSQGSAPGLMYQPVMTGKLMLHTTANGKAWLATLGDERAAQLALASDLGKTTAQAVGPHAVATVEGLLRELAATRQRGYGLANEEAEPGIKAIAVVVRAVDDERVVGTISIAGPLLRMGPERDAEFHQLLGDAAARLRLIWPRKEELAAQIAA